MINDHTTALLCRPIPGFHWPTMTYCILIDLHTKDHNIDKRFVQMTPPVANVRCLCGSTVTFSLFFLQAAENEDGGDSHRRAPSWCTPHHAAWYRKRYSKRWMSRWNEKDQHFPFGHEVSLVEYNTSYWGEWAPVLWERRLIHRYSPRDSAKGCKESGTLCYLCQVMTFHQTKAQRRALSCLQRRKAVCVPFKDPKDGPAWRHPV